MKEAPLRLGISACLLGNSVRHDGGHKRDAFLVDELGPWVEWIPVCPEVELGMGVPRPTIRLERTGSGVRLIEPRSGADHTGPMRAFAADRVEALAALDLCGYVLKKDSPSCGLERVRIWGTSPGHPPERSGRGLFAQALTQQMPLLPVEEEGRLHDPQLRQNFIARIFAYRRLRRLFAPRWRIGDLVRFHTAHKLVLLAHEPRSYQALGRMVAEARAIPRAELSGRYGSGFMRALSRIATRERHANVLAHAQGYFRKRISADARAELTGLIAEYQRGLVPLVVPLTLIRHHVRALGIEYLAGQVYLDPHPRELMLLNRV